MPTAMEEYKFDLRGHVILKQALDPDHVQEINRWVDALPSLELGQWVGNINVHRYQDHDGANLQNIIEGGDLFQRLIDHSSWIELVRHYIGTMATPFIHECFLNIRESGGFIGLHSGGELATRGGRIAGGIVNGQWCQQYLTLIIALSDIGPGDGATMIIPGSHKSALPHPLQSSTGEYLGSVQNAECAVEMHLGAGDALLFNDLVAHGSAARTNPGERRTLVFRYLPRGYAHRWAYVPSEELWACLTSEQRVIVQPVEPCRRPDGSCPD